MPPIRPPAAAIIGAYSDFLPKSAKLEALQPGQPDCCQLISQLQGTSVLHTRWTSSGHQPSGVSLVHHLNCEGTKIVSEPIIAENTAKPDTVRDSFILFDSNNILQCTT
ncbi:hypothetical protein CEXT_649181 [Caerostris extrusa]|uniref:Uncharacterized protein n=1 Tax=Caerostris extrusa TaxID=172846 RepID=A0AAV4NQ61_CAEEX|nr:hypothetical protein CEXT_649181 [Caerostris extrusa]